ncbi:MAG: hypothetical protein K2N73_13620, partial [Lachnospiraceae bacterium]|nr:hypothetical protein [Lachnospiraceae bacterium]
AKSVIIHTSITYKLMKTGVGVNCNMLSRMFVQKTDLTCFYVQYGVIIMNENTYKKPPLGNGDIGL